MTAPKSKFEKLISAVRKGDAARVRRLVGGDPWLGTASDSEEGWTALMSAARLGHAECLDALIPVSDCNAVDIDGWNALMISQFNEKTGLSKCFELLLPVTNCKATDLCGRTALMIVAWQGEVECVKALLPLSDCEAVDNDGCSALMWAAFEGHVDCVEALLPFAELRAVNKEGLSASDLARRSGARNIARTRGQQEAADLIDSYDLAQEERASLASLTEGRAASRAKARSL